MPSLVDTHSHLYVGRFGGDIDDVMARAREAGLEAVIVPATKPSEFDDAFALADRFPEIRVAVGVHPHHAHEVDDADLDAIERIGASGRAIAIGEIGLDYYYEFAPRDRQQEVFRRQLIIARTLGLPAAIHNRESDDDVLDIIEQEQDGSLRFQLHCFSSDKAVLERSLALGAMISFTGNITYSKGTLDDVVRATPDDRIMLETDAPYLTPVPHRGKRNEPSYVSLVAAKAAELRGTTLDAIKEMTTLNARRFFGLTLLLLAILGLCSDVAMAQPRQVGAVDTTTPPPFNKIVGIGGLMASSTYIRGSTTEGSAVGFGGWLSVVPLQPIDIDWLQVDLAYTSVRVNPTGLDTASENVRRQFGDSGKPIPPNFHRTFDIKLRATVNARKTVTFFGTFGLTYFDNEFGIDEYLIQKGDKILTEFREKAWGVSGSIGLSLNINTPYLTIAPTAEWHVATITGERPLSQRKLEFFVSQPRVGILLYPNFNSIFR